MQKKQQVKPQTFRRERVIRAIRRLHDRSIECFAEARTYLDSANAAIDPQQPNITAREYYMGMAEMNSMKAKTYRASVSEMCYQLEIDMKEIAEALIPTPADQEEQG